jgi:predicted nucleic acid-binding protein
MSLTRVIADAGPLIAFGRIGRLDLLPTVLGEVLVPSPVIRECLALPLRPGGSAIQAAQKQGLLVERAVVEQPAFIGLDVGESAALRLAQSLDVPLLMDERAGRAVAHNLGIAVIGSAGVLLVAKQRSLIPSVAPLLLAMRDNGYRFSDSLFTGILAKAGE